MIAVTRGAPDHRRGDGAGPALPVRARADDRVGERHRAGLGPGQGVAALRRVLPKQIGGAAHGRRHAHLGEGVDHAELRHGEVGRDAPLLPFAPLHPHRVEGGRHAHPGALIRPLAQKLHAGIAQVLVAHTGDLRMRHRHQIGRAVDARQRHDDLHRTLDARSLGAVQHRLVLQKSVLRHSLVSLFGAPMLRHALTAIVAYGLVFVKQFWGNGKQEYYTNHIHPIYFPQ